MTGCVVEAAAEAASNVHILNQAPGKWKYGTREFYQLCKKDKKCYNKEMKLGQNTSKTFMEISFVKDHLEKDNFHSSSSDDVIESTGSHSTIRLTLFHLDLTRVQRILSKLGECIHQSS